MRLLVFFILFFSVNLHATIELIDVQGASNFTGIGTNSVEGEAIAIYGGTAGTSCTGATTSDTCDSCTIDTAFTAACNSSRIYSTLRLQITFTSTVTGTTAIGDSAKAVVAAMPIIDAQTGVAAGTQHVAIVEWQSVCSGLLSIGANCETSASGTISVGVDGNGNGSLADDEDDSTTISINVVRTITAVAKACDNSTLSDTAGICNFSVFPGDNKVFLETLEAPSGFPNGDNTAADKIRFYFSAFTANDTSTTTLAKFQSITHNSEFFETDIELEESGSLKTKQDTFSDGIVNGDEYFFRIATVDLAGNLGFHTPDLRADNSAEFHTLNIHSAQPSPVTGLLSEDIQCFIATAAYGSPFEKHVKTLRLFRNKFLQTNFIGKQLISTYYKFSPPLAKYISSKPMLKKIIRLLLTPIVFLADLTLSSGFLLPFLLLLLLFLPFFIVSLLIIKKRTTKI